MVAMQQPSMSDSATLCCKPIEKQVSSATISSTTTKHKRRFCRIPDCTRIVKSQGLCQRHGAKPRKCKIDGCTKQAQGNFDGMCKAHFKIHHEEEVLSSSMPSSTTSTAPVPSTEATSVYNEILPSSISWMPNYNQYGYSRPMPLLTHLRDGFFGTKPLAWHRNEERRARGLMAVPNSATPFEDWERELIWMEILVLTGNPEADFNCLAYAWGRENGFHTHLAQFVCNRYTSLEADSCGQQLMGQQQFPSSNNINNVAGLPFSMPLTQIPGLYHQVTPSPVMQMSGNNVVVSAVSDNNYLEKLSQYLQQSDQQVHDVSLEPTPIDESSLTMRNYALQTQQQQQQQQQYQQFYQNAPNSSIETNDYLFDARPTDAISFMPSNDNRHHRQRSSIIDFCSLDHADLFDRLENFDEL